jgi:hypothetical protein
MPVFLDTTGNSSLGIAICGRCGLKYPRDELSPDPNIPGLYVCPEDRDQFDPWRLAPREADRIAMDWVRPDIVLGPSPYDVPVNPIQAVIEGNWGQIIPTDVVTDDAIAVAPPVTPVRPSTVWSPGTAYVVGDQVTAFNPVGPAAAGLQIFIYLCVVPGISGANPPNWPSFQGVDVLDNQITWMNNGLYLP